MSDLISAIDPFDFTGTEAKKDAIKATNRATDAQVDASQAAINEQQRQFDATQASLQPYQEAGASALMSQQDLLGLNGVSSQQSAYDALSSSPGQQFLQDRAQKNLLRNSSAIGGLGGGNVRSALVEQGVGFAQQDIDNQFGRLGQLAGQGQSAATNVGQFGQQASSNIQSNLLSQGDARATGIYGVNQANVNQTQQMQGLVTAAAQMFSDPKLKSNRKKIGHKNGYTLWSWVWNEAANKIGLHGESKGVMADEVKEKTPEAIGEKNGYMTVNYKMIGV